KVYDKMVEAEEDVLAYRHFPKVHHRKIYSNNPLERLNREIRRRTNVIGIFPNDASVLRLIGEVLHQIDEDWLVQQSYMGLASMQPLMTESESDNDSI
ncbi:MAG: transposase, partial [Proteobacteria bacterium]|nr:transposase [Pseudomonadota bacterium]